MIRALDLHPLERLNLGIASGALAVSLLVAPAGFSSSLALGVALEAVNFRALRLTAGRLLSGQLGGGGTWVALLGMRLVMLMVSMGIALAAGAHPIALLIGVSTIVPAVLVGAWIWRPAVDPDAPALPPDDPSWDHYSVWLAREVEPASEEDEA